MSCASPLAFFVYRRPDYTARVFERIQAARPPVLLIIADGPRSIEEEKLCEQTRDLVSSINWDCQVKRLYAEHNLGCKKRLVSGLSWVFEQVEEAIILEDDCLPSDAFFPFCDELLDRYRNEARVAMITGCNFQEGHLVGDASYYFSRYAHVWGWATWRRAWQVYDPDLLAWPAQKRSSSFQKRFTPQEWRYWSPIFDAMYAQNLDTWDYQWLFSLLFNATCSVVPNANLISNIGFGEDATHTRGGSPLAALPFGELHTPLIHPDNLEISTAADKRSFDRVFAPEMQAPPHILSRVFRKLRNFTHIFSTSP